MHQLYWGLDQHLYLPKVCGEIFGQENGAHQRAGEKIKHGEIKRTSGEKTQRTKRQGEIIKKFRPPQIQRQRKTDPQEKPIFK